MNRAWPLTIAIAGCVIFGTSLFCAAASVATPDDSARLILQPPLPQDRSDAAQDQPPGQSQSAMLSDGTAAEVKRLVMTFKQAALDEDAVIRAAAVRAMGAFVDYDGSIIDIVIDRARNDEPSVKLAAMNVLRTVEEPSEQAMDAMLALLCDEDIAGDNRERLLLTIVNHGAAAVVPRAVSVLQSGDEREQLRMISLLASFDEDAVAAVEPLMHIAADQQASVVVRAAAMECSAAILGTLADNEIGARRAERFWADQADAAMARYDTDSDGKIARQELARALAGRPGNGRGRFTEQIEFYDEGTAFVSTSLDSIDTDGDSVLTHSELENFLKQVLPNGKSQGRSRGSRGRGVSREFESSLPAGFGGANAGRRGGG